MKKSLNESYVDVLLPLALEGTFSYLVPAPLVERIAKGQRVEVVFGTSKLYGALVYKVHQNKPSYSKIKPILNIIDKKPIINEQQFKFWEWISSYYMCSLGLVMQAALPSHFLLSSDAYAFLQTDDNLLEEALSLEEEIIYRALQKDEFVKTHELRKLVGKKSILGLLRSMTEKKWIKTSHHIQKTFKSKTQKYIRLNPSLDEDQLSNIYEIDLRRAAKQQEALLSIIETSENQKEIARTSLSHIKSNILKALEEKNIIISIDRVVSRIEQHKPSNKEAAKELTIDPAQHKKIKNLLKKDGVKLLHDAELIPYLYTINKKYKQGEQCLILIPNIDFEHGALSMIQSEYPNDFIYQNSKLGNDVRYEIWDKVQKGVRFIIGTRSSLFLPFKNLKHILLLQEHDPAYKQFDPSPRYHARDAAIILAHQLKAKISLFSNTPSFESLLNNHQKKYFSLQKPENAIKGHEIELIDLQKASKQRALDGSFSKKLTKQIAAALAQKEQVIIVKNRRGYAPVLVCKKCDWKASCPNCDVKLTYHQFSKKFICHYCDYKARYISQCKECHATDLELKGFGTQKLEEELELIFPMAKIVRVDSDTASGRKRFQTIQEKFLAKKIDILVGTQLAAKMIHASSLKLIAFVSGDQMINRPDFRSEEKAFQYIQSLLEKKGDQTKVLIQSWNPEQAFYLSILGSDYYKFAFKRMRERQLFHYPPFVRMIHVTLKHKEKRMAERAAHLMVVFLKKKWGDRVQGPITPAIERMFGKYHVDVVIKHEKQRAKMDGIKKSIKEANLFIAKQSDLKSVRISINVDPH